ncbi:unnamed protein product [Orchesella dallaii]|uniref:F-box domain-containing protein n=1 Tax=Orchesella dallaii TaxID=48710 RepID=A0ABP1R440_9HEXA
MERFKVAVDEPSDDDGNKVQLFHLPEDIMTLILSYIPQYERNEFLTHRLVNKNWTRMINNNIESAIIAGLVEPFPDICKCKIQSRLQSSEQDVTKVSPFNGLRVNGYCGLDDVKPQCEDGEETTMSIVPAFLQHCGQDITSFAICGLQFYILDLPTILNNLRSLKLLRLLNLNITTNMTTMALELPPLPRLAHLINLDFCGDYHDEGQTILLYSLLVISYSGQILKLKIDTEQAMPPLKPLRQNSLNVNGRRFGIGTTTANAFHRLKELIISSPQDFLLETRTPSLKRLAINGVNLENSPSLTYITHFMDSCQALEFISLNISWDDLVVQQVERMPEFTEGALHPTCEVNLPELATFHVNYPSFKNMKVLAHTFLPKFPGLKTLHLTDFETENGPAFDGTDRASRLDRDLMLSTLYKYIGSKFPEKSMEEAVVSEMASFHGVWKTCTNFQ